MTMTPDTGASPISVPDAVGRLRMLSRGECLQLLTTISVGRLGVSIQALPAILPVNFVLADGRIIIRTIHGTKLHAAAAQEVVAFEADDFDPAGEWGWSVLVRGRGAEITDPGELADARGLGLRSWAFGHEIADRFIGIGTAIVTGRRF